MAGIKYHPSTPYGSQYFCCPIFYCITTLLPWGTRYVLFKSKYPPNANFYESFGFDISILNRFNFIWDWLRRPHHRWNGKISQHHIVQQWSYSYMCGWIDMLHLSCAYVGEPIVMLLIIFCEKFWVPLNLLCTANVLMVWIHCSLIHHELFLGTYDLFSCYVLKGFSDDWVVFITI